MRRSMLWLLVGCLGVALPLFAQKITGTISGVVSDPAGAVISGADVTITNGATGEQRTAKTNDHGEYAVTDLNPGTYTVTVKAPNFKEYVAKGVQLFVSSTATANAMLSVGSTTEVMTVEANTVQVETSTGAVGNVVEGREVRELPLNGRSFAQLTQLMPGVSPAANFDSKHKGLEAGVDFSVNGNNTTGNLFLVDGVNNNDVGSNRTIVIYPSIDAIQEFKILRNSYGPEYGQAMGAVVSIVTKSGTNQFHGGAYYFGRNDALNATDYFNNLNHAPKDKLRRNDWGYDVGGPIVKDKLFFFWSQEWNHELRGKLRSASVPTVAEKAGDFSNLRTGAGCNDPVPTYVRTNPDKTTTTFKFTNINQVGAAIPGSGVSPTGQLILNLFPDPNVANPVNCINWAESLTSPIKWREESVRADYKIGKTWSLFGRYTQDHWNQPSPSTLGYWGDDRYPSVDPNWVQPGYQATIKLTKLIGATAVNDFQVSYSANKITVSNNNPAAVEAINASYQTYFPTSDKFLGKDVGYPVFWGGLGNGANADNLWNMGPWHNNEDLYIIRDDLSKVSGAHTFKVGFLASNNKKNELSGGSSGEAPNYWGANANNTNNGAFNALWDSVGWGFSESATNPFAETRWHDYEFYFGDSWKVRRNITVEYGARWSFLRNPFSAVNKISSWQPKLFNPVLGGAGCNGLYLVPGTNPCQAAGFLGGVPGPNRSLRENNDHMIAPRLGIAWDPKSDGKMVFRAGLGQFFQRDRISNYLYIATNSPFSVSAGGTRPLSGSVPAGSLTSSASPSWGIDPGTSMPNTWQYNLTFEKEVYRDSKLELAYVGNRGLHILRYKDSNAVLAQNRLDFALNNGNSDRFTGGANFGTINYGLWDASSNYNALQALFRTRMKALDMQFAYTWSKSLANTDITNSGNTSNYATQTDSTNPNLDYGPTQINRTHVFVSNIVYDLPGFTGHSAPVRLALGGWELAGILGYGSGPSQSIFGLNGGATNAPGGIQGTGYNPNQKPNRVLQDCRAHGAPKFQWYNPAAFTLDNYQLGTFGNSSVGSCSGPGIANTDFSMYKNFKLTERFTMQFRMEFFNFFNTPQFRADQINLQLASGATACTAAKPCAGYSTNTVSWNFAQNGQANFGQAGSSGVPGDRGPREIQYALKLTF